MNKSQTRPSIDVEKRDVVGKKVKKLRKEGILPLNIYGKEIKSVSLKANALEFQKFYSQHGETSLVDIMIKGEKKPRTVLMKNPQFDPITDEIIHLDIHEVSLKDKVTANIPIEVVGESPVAETGEGIQVQVLDGVEVEALPTDLPEKFVVDALNLKKLGDAITVADLEVDKNKIEIKANPEQIILQLEEPREEEPEMVEEVAPEEVPATQQKAETEGEEEKSEDKKEPAKPAQDQASEKTEEKKE